MTELSENSKYRDIVESYMQNRLPQEGMHSSFQHLSSEKTVDLSSPPPAYSQTELDLPSMIVSSIEGSEDSDSDVMIEELYGEAEMETQHFIQATIAYEQATLATDPEHQSMIDWSHNHTWQEVLEVVDSAAQAFQDTSSMWGKVRKAFRSVGSNQKVFAAWMEILPTQSQYASVLFGGLKLIFGAASRLKTLREEACEALSQIPISLAMTGNVLKSFSASVDLHKCSSALYVAILATLEQLLKYYKGNSAKRMMKATFKQDEYESKLSEKIKIMNAYSRMFKDLAVQCSYQTQQSTLGNVKVLKTQAKARHRTVMQQIARSRSEASLQHLDTNRNLREGSENSQRSIHDLQDEVIRLRADQANLHTLLTSRDENRSVEMDSLKTELKKVLKEFHRSNGRIDRRTNDIWRPLNQEKHGATEVAALSRERAQVTEKALAGLEFDIELLSDDIEANVRHVWTLPLSAQDRAVTLMESENLHTWLTTTNPSALFVNGQYDAAARQSPLTYVCTKLVDTIGSRAAGTSTRHSSILAQVFFCGQHLSLEDSAFGPAGMMRNLISQLVINHGAFDLRAIRRLLDLDSSNIGELCDAFAGLIRQLTRRHLVLCVIDGISFYEDSPTQCEAAKEAIQSLLQAMENCKETGCTLKLLITCPGTSRAIYREFEDEEVIWMPQKVESRGGLTPAKWEASAQVHVQNWLETDLVE